MNRGPRPVPARITQALDLRELYGPEVDVACGTWEGNPAGDVDAWEAGTHSPIHAQVEKLAALTRFPPEFFYRPVEDTERDPVWVFICDGRRRGENGLTVVESWTDWDGVAHIRQLTPDRPPYRPRKVTSSPAAPAQRPFKGAHEPVEDPDAPGCCRVCRLPLDIPNRRHTNRDSRFVPPSGRRAG